MLIHLTAELDTDIDVVTSSLDLQGMYTLHKGVAVHKASCVKAVFGSAGPSGSRDRLGRV